jgi:hypothetical protein
MKAAQVFHSLFCCSSSDDKRTAGRMDGRVPAGCDARSHDDVMLQSALQRRFERTAAAASNKQLVHGGLSCDT